MMTWWNTVSTLSELTFKDDFEEKHYFYIFKIYKYILNFIGPQVL